MSTLDWKFCSFDELSLRELYAILMLRQEVFGIEQQSLYQDVDGQDPIAMHMLVQEGETLAAYLRILPPGTHYEEPAMGRILTAQKYRGIGLGRELMDRGLEATEKLYPGKAIRIEAQVYLEKFYRDYAFEVVGEAYILDGIPHIEMLRPAN